LISLEITGIMTALTSSYFGGNLKSIFFHTISKSQSSKSAADKSQNRAGKFSPKKTTSGRTMPVMQSLHFGTPSLRSEEI
jgi:hypothetical protein